MGYSRRGIDPSSAQTAENDAQYFEYQYSGTSGALTIGKPVYVDVTDSGEFNSLIPATALIPAAPRTCGRATVGTDPKAGTNLLPLGIFDPHDQNPGLTPNTGDVIRVCVFGRCVISVQSAAGGAAATVGGAIVGTNANNDAAPGARVTGQNIGIVTATRAAITPGATVVAAASATPTLVNGFVNLS